MIGWDKSLDEPAGRNGLSEPDFELLKKIIAAMPDGEAHPRIPSLRTTLFRPVVSRHLVMVRVIWVMCRGSKLGSRVPYIIAVVSAAPPSGPKGPDPVPQGPFGPMTPGHTAKLRARVRQLQELVFLVPQV